MTHFPSSPDADQKKRKIRVMMKSLRQIIFAMAMVVGLTLGVSAQKGGDEQKRPPKDPKVIKPGDKPPRGNPPKGDDRPKKPRMGFFLVVTEKRNDTA